MKLKKHRKDKTYFDVLYQNFSIFTESKQGVKNLKTLIFQLALNGKLDFQKLSEGRIKKPLQTLIKEQKHHLKKEGIAFEENSKYLWPMIKLGDICQIFSGSRPKGGAIESGILSIGGEHINYDGTFKLSKPKYIPTQFFNKMNRGQLQLKDVLIVKDGATTGKTGYFDKNSPFKKGAVNEHVFVLRSKNENVEAFYLYQFFKSKKGNSEILSYKTGSAQGGINLSIKKILIPLPPLVVQKEIVALMGKCNLLEAQTKEKFQKQEELSKSSMYFITQSKKKKETSYNWKTLKHNFRDALYSEQGVKSFKSMAFQLALNGKLDFQKLSEGRIRKPLQTLIKEQKQHLKKEGIAFEELPNNIWPIVTLNSICKILDNKRKPVKKSNRKSGKYPYYGATGILDYIDNYIFDEKLVLVGEDGAKWKSGENTSFIAEGQYWVNNHAHVLRPNRKYIIDELLVYILNEKDISLFVTGVTVPKLNQQKLCSIKIPLLSVKVQKEIIALMEYIENIEKQIQEEKNLSIQLSKSLSHI